MTDTPGTTPPPASDPPPVQPAQATPGTAPASEPAAAQAQQQARAVAAEVMGDNSLKAGAAGFILVFIGLLLPWITVSAGPFSASRSGISTGDGKVVFVLAIIAAAGLYLRRSLVALIAGGLAAALTIYDAIDIGRLGGDVPGEAKSLIDAGTGIGVWLVLVGAIALTAAGLLQRRGSQ